VAIETGRLMAAQVMGKRGAEERGKEFFLRA